MIYIKQDITDTFETIELSIPISVSKFYSPLNFTLFNAQSHEVYFASDLANSSFSEHFIVLVFSKEDILKLPKGYYSYAVRDGDNNLIASGLLVIEGENAVNTVYNQNQTNIVYQG